MGRARTEYDEKRKNVRYYRSAAKKAREADDALDRLNKETGDPLIGFDLGWLAEQFDKRADELEGKVNDGNDAA